jgi:major membrane immunogen (membrane-anchored lipoprotein)
MMRLVFITASALLLAACGEPDQASTASRYMPDTHPFEGAKNAYVVKGWTAGDKLSWEKQLRERGQYQNEYVKVN